MTELATLEAPITTTIKASEDRDAPWIVIRSKDAAHLESQLAELEHGPALTSVGRLAAVFRLKSGLGANLGARNIDPQEPSTTFTPPAGQPVTVDAEPAARPTQPAAPAQPVQLAGQGSLFTGAPTGQPATELPQLPAPGPVAPMTPFGPAIPLGSKPGDEPVWRAWGDPRPVEQIGHLRKPEFFTADPQDPGLAAGSKMFMQRIG